MPEFYERRSGRDRRDWDVFHHPDRRSGRERRSGKDRRKAEVEYDGPERRRLAVNGNGSPKVEHDPLHSIPEKPHYSTAEVAKITGLTQSTLLLWIRNRVIDGSRIKRSGEGRRLWTREDIEAVRRVKVRNGWL